MGEYREEEWLEIELDRIADLLDAAGIPYDNAGEVLSPSERVEEALARLRAKSNLPNPAMRKTR